MPFRNPLVAGESLIRTAIRSRNYSPNEAGWRISRTGNAELNELTARASISGTSGSFDNFVANQSFIYRGDELADIIDPLPKGGIVEANVTASQTSNSSGDIIGWFGLDFSRQPVRAYEMFLSPTELTRDTPSDYVNVYIQATFDGSTPTVNSEILAIYNIPSNNNGGSFDAVHLSYKFNYNSGDSDDLVRLLVSFDGSGASTLNPNNRLVRCVVKDIGRDGSYLPNSGYLNDGGGASLDPAAWHTFDVDSRATRSYAGDDTIRNVDGESIYQGNSGSTSDDLYGNQFSYIWFKDSVTGNGDGGTLNDMEGISSSDIDYLDVFLYFEHWWYAEGGNAHIGWHSLPYGNRDNTPSGHKFPNRRHVNNIPRETGRWVSIKGTGIETAIIDGSFNFHGVMFGPADPNDLEHYGYCRGDNMNRQPRIRGRYFK